MNYNKERDILLMELACRIPNWTTEQYELLKHVAARLAKENGVPMGDALKDPRAMNRAIISGISLGYAMALQDVDHGQIVTPRFEHVN